MRGKERLKQEADCSRSVGGRFNKQRNLTYKACLGRLPDLTWPDLGSITHTIQMVSTPPYFLKAVSLKELPLWEQQAEHTL